MPRIYYSEADYRQQVWLFAVHSMVYACIVAFFWFRQPPGIAVIVSLWTALLAYHAYWHTPLQTGMQQRTYDRLRNRLGPDWDIAASVAEFDAERRKALVELRLHHLLRDSVRVGLAVVAAWILMLFTRATIVPVDYFVAALVGFGLMLIGLKLRLQWDLREARRKLTAVQAAKATGSGKKAAQTQHSTCPTFQMPRPGMMYAVGDDGELVEIQRDTP